MRRLAGHMCRSIGSPWAPLGSFCLDLNLLGHPIHYSYAINYLLIAIKTYILSIHCIIPFFITYIYLFFLDFYYFFLLNSNNYV